MATAGTSGRLGQSGGNVGGLVYDPRTGTYQLPPTTIQSSNPGYDSVDRRDAMAAPMATQGVVRDTSGGAPAGPMASNPADDRLNAQDAGFRRMAMSQPDPVDTRHQDADAFMANEAMRQRLASTAQPQAAPRSAAPQRTGAAPTNSWDANNAARLEQEHAAGEDANRKAVANAQRETEIARLTEATKSPPAVSRTSGPSAQQEEAARSATFARAKDQVGQLARSALTSLREGGGMGGGRERSGVAGIVGQGQNVMGNVIRDQQTEELNRALHLGDEDFQGQIAQRGQNMQRNNSLLSLFNAGRAY